jgi:hypothetical protein
MDRRSGKQRRKPTRFLKNSANVGRRLDDIEFSLFLKMGIFTGLVLISCIIAAMFIA